jgi:hypothetical protein
MKGHFFLKDAAVPFFVPIAEQFVQLDGLYEAGVAEFAEAADHRR